VSLAVVLTSLPSPRRTVDTRLPGPGCGPFQARLTRVPSGAHPFLPLVRLAVWATGPARSAKNIQNEAHVNEDADQRTLLRKYERELRRLRDELARRSRNVVDKRALLMVRGGKAAGRRAGRAGRGVQGWESYTP
jgi:hypothetical protein